MEINSPWVHPRRPLPLSWEYTAVKAEELDSTDWIDSVYSLIMPTVTEANNFIPEYVLALTLFVII